MINKVMIENKSSHSMSDVMNYLAGYTTKLNGIIEVITIPGTYYDNIIINDI